LGENISISKKTACCLQISVIIHTSFICLFSCRITLHTQLNAMSRLSSSSESTFDQSEHIIDHVDGCRLDLLSLEHHKLDEMGKSRKPYNCKEVRKLFKSD
jgi:hypothetical protein